MDEAGEVAKNCQADVDKQVTTASRNEGCRCRREDNCDDDEKDIRGLDWHVVVVVQVRVRS